MNVQHVHLFAKYVLGLYITRVPNVMTLTFYKNQLLLVLQLVKAVIGLMHHLIIYACYALLNVQHVLPKLFVKAAKQIFIYKPQIV